MSFRSSTLGCRRSAERVRPAQPNVVSLRLRTLQPARCGRRALNGGCSHAYTPLTRRTPRSNRSRTTRAACCADRAAGDPPALQRLREFLPRLRGADDAAISLGRARSGTTRSPRSRANMALPAGRASRRTSTTGKVRPLDLPLEERIEDPTFRRAVALMDLGDETELAAHLIAHPDLATQRVFVRGRKLFPQPEPPRLHRRKPDPPRVDASRTRSPSPKSSLKRAAAMRRASMKPCPWSASGRVPREAACRSPSSMGYRLPLRPALAAAALRPPSAVTVTRCS